MLPSRNETERLEQMWLGPYAAKSSESHGRKYGEQSHERRAEFQRDRDRIIHSRCFRRLEYKTQVFINGTADHYRTRLTHTLEMSMVGRTIARAVKANEDLTEAIALAHDIGHSPFGHSGERALNELMQKHGGFDHNIQSLRWVEELELRYPNHPGLNLTWETRAGLHKHEAEIPGYTLDGRPIGPFQYVEAQIADVADDLTYAAHDVDDGLDAGLLDEAKLNKVELWRRAVERAEKSFPGIVGRQRLLMGVRALIDMQVADIVNHTASQLEKFKPQSPRDVMTATERIANFSPAFHPLVLELRDFLFENLYWHPTVEKANEEAVALMKKLFQHYVAHPAIMGTQAQSRIATDGLMRAVCDYISGMTDRYAMDEVRKLGLDRA
jgi:dGTPase